MDRNEVNLRTITKVSISLERKEIPQQMHKRTKCKIYAGKQKRVTMATGTKTPPNERINEWLCTCVWNLGAFLSRLLQNNYLK